MHEERTPRGIGTGGSVVAWSGRVHRFGTVGSTMAEARSLADAGAPHGTAVVATEQGAGRGRSGREWVSHAGNLYTTVVLRPGIQARHAPQLGFVAAIAVAAALDGLAGPLTRLKWPNDVMRDGAKIAGILIEGTGDGVLLAGIGVNVGHSPPDMPYPTTSLLGLGCTAKPEAVLSAILHALRAECEAWQALGFGAVLHRWALRGPAIGTALQVRLGADTVPGRFAGLRGDGALLLDTADGQRAVVAGDVQPCNGAAERAKTVGC